MVLWTVYIHVLQASSHHIINISSSSSRITVSWMLSLETNIISECNGQRDTIQYYSAQLCVCLSVGLSVNRRGMSAAPPIDPRVSSHVVSSDAPFLLQSCLLLSSSILPFTRRQHGCQGHGLVLADAPCDDGVVIASVILASVGTMDKVDGASIS